MRQTLWQRRKAALLLAVALIAGGLATLAYADHLLRRPEQQAIDARFQIRGAEPRRTAGIVVVGVESQTINAFRQEHLENKWPFPRLYDARVIDRLHRGGAKVIAFDAQFTEESSSGLAENSPLIEEKLIAEDDALVEAVRRAGNVVLSTAEPSADGATDVLGGDEVLRSIHARAGNTTVRQDSDGTLRNTQFEISNLRTFGVVAAEVDTGRAVPASLFGGRRTPVPIDYAGPPGTVPTISYSRVYKGEFPHDFFAGKIVVVGVTSVEDVHETPMSGDLMAGPEIMANTTVNVLDGIPLRKSAGWVTVLLIAAFALAVCIAGMRLGTLGVALVGLGIFLLWSLSSQLAFNAGALLDFSDPTASLILATGGTVIVGLWADGRERRRLRNLFAADSSEIVEEILHPSGPRSLQATSIIAGYRIDAVLARGGMGVVYRATQLALERTVAIKLIATERSQDPVFRSRFERESRLAASIEHVNVIPVYEAGDDDGLLFIAMRLVEGADLAQVLNGAGMLEPERTVRLVAALGGALDAAHARGLVHRDVKPGNVLLTLDQPEHLYLTDFGVAKHIGGAEGMTVAGEWVGTLDYLAPEQIRGEEVGPGADIYALAALLHHCLTGQVPFPRDNEAAKLWAQVNAPPPSASKLRPDLPEGIDQVIARGMAKSPAERFQSASDLARACAESLGVDLHIEAPGESAIDPRAQEHSGPAAPTVISD